MTGSVRWIRRGETVEVNGFRLFTGLFYLGRSFGDPNTFHDKYVVNPALPVGRKASTDLATNDWVVAYEGMSPETRRGFLEWLSAGCRNTDVPLAFVRLYMGGLYYRVLIDRGDDAATALAEARRIAKLYRERTWCRDVAVNLVLFSSGIGYKRGQKPVAMPEWAESIHVPLDVTLRIADLISRGEAVDADDGWLWARQRGKLDYPVGDRQAEEALRLLWNRTYAKRYPFGLVCKDLPSRRLKPSLSMPDGVRVVAVPVPDWCTKLPDPREAVSFDTALCALHAECHLQLKSYLKEVRKAGGVDVTLAAMSALPKTLVATSLAGRFGRVKETLDAALSRQGAVTSKVARVLQVMGVPVDPAKELTPAVVKMIGSALDKLDVAFEPDKRYGNAGFTNGGSVVFFRGADGLPVDAEGDYVAVQAAADFLMGQLCGDDRDAAFAEKCLFDVCRTRSGFGEAERTRLAAYARAVWANRGEGWKGVKHSRLDGGGRALAVSAVVSAVASWHGLAPSMIGKAEKFVEKLGGDRRELHAALHRFSADDDEPILVIPADKAAAHPVPHEADGGLGLDMARLGRLEEDTAVVASLLSDIFADSDEAAPADERPAAATAWSGLDRAHCAVLDAVVAAGRMTRGDFEAVARENACLPEGALETVNEWAFDNFGSAILVDDGDIMFEEYLRDDLERTRATA
jgi:hypothetical protein